MAYAQLAFSYFKVLLDWPFIMAVLVFAFFCMFREQIASLLKGVASGKIKAFGVEIEPQKQHDEKREASAELPESSDALEEGVFSQTCG